MHVSSSAFVRSSILQHRARKGGRRAANRKQVLGHFPALTPARARGGAARRRRVPRERRRGYGVTLPVPTLRCAFEGYLRSRPNVATKTRRVGRLFLRHRDAFSAQCSGVHQGWANSSGRLGRVREGWLNYFAIPGSSRYIQCVPPQAATPVDTSVALAVPASPLRLEATGAHDLNPVGTCFNPTPMTGPAVCRQSPEVGGRMV